MAERTLATAALFDLDGVVVSTDRLHFQAWQAVCDAKEWSFDEETNDLLRGVPRMASLEIILARNKIELPQKEKELLAELKNLVYKDSLKTLKSSDIIPGALELIRKMKEAGAKTAICSSSRNAGEVLDQLSLRGLFEAVVTGNEVAKAKPDPEIFLLGARLLDVSPADCVVLEDAQSGVQAALAAGMRCVGLGDPKLLAGADLILESLLDCPAERALAAGRRSLE